MFIYLSSAKNILHKARKGHDINKCKNTGRGDATAMPITALPNVVLTPKKDSESVRASLYVINVNKYIKRTRHPIPTLRELETRLDGTKYFSHLDMNDAYFPIFRIERPNSRQTRDPRAWQSSSSSMTPHLDGGDP